MNVVKPALLVLAVSLVLATTPARAVGDGCKKIHADLDEIQSSDRKSVV